MSNDPTRLPVSDDSDSSDGDSDWLDVEADEERTTVVCFFDEQTFTAPSEMFAYCRDKHGFDFPATIARLQLDFYGAIKLVNFIRHYTEKGLSLPKEIANKDIEDDAYLKPVLENDALLFSLDDILEIGEKDGHADSGTSESVNTLLSRNRELEEELETIRNQFGNYRLTVEQTLDKRWGDESDAVPSTSASKDNSDYYFESYAANEIHETMLKDAVRTDAYRDFIYSNKGLFKDKVVLDIGCGTGILSMFAAKAGAKQVIAVDKSDIMNKARENIFNNGLSDIITCVKGAIEDVVLPVAEVDVIISEWMGYFLLYEAMLPSVLYARDKYLKPNGILAPSSMTMWMAPVADPDFMSDHVSFWRDIYGFDMKAMMEGIFEDARIEVQPKNTICGKPYPFKVLDLYKVNKEDLTFTAKWESSLDKDIDELDGFTIWFDNFFAITAKAPLPADETTCEEFVKQKQGNVAFTTGPFDTPTHWKQGLLLTNRDDSYKKLTKSCKLAGALTYAVAEDNERALKISVEWTRDGEGKRKQSWKMK